MVWKILIDSDLCIYSLNGMCEEKRNAGKNKWCEEKNCPLRVSTSMLVELNKLIEMDARALEQSLRGEFDKDKVIEEFEFSNIGFSDIISAEIKKRAEYISKERMKAVEDKLKQEAGQ